MPLDGETVSAIMISVWGALKTTLGLDWMLSRKVVLAFHGAPGYPDGRVNSAEETRKVEITESVASS